MLNVKQGIKNIYYSFIKDFPIGFVLENAEKTHLCEGKPFLLSKVDPVIIFFHSNKIPIPI